MGTFHPSRAAVATAAALAPAAKRAEAVLAEVEAISAPRAVVSRLAAAFNSTDSNTDCRAGDDALAVQVLRAIGSPADGRLDVDAVIEHSLAVAYAAEALAQHADLPPRQAYFAGALHDLGKLVLNCRLPRAYSRVIERTIAEHRDLCDVETDVLGADHTRAGRRLAAHWGLPREVQDSAWLHHHLPADVEQLSDFPKLVALVHVADAVARRLRPGFAGFGRGEPSPDTLRLLGVSNTTLCAIESSVADRLQSLAAAASRPARTGTRRKTPLGRELHALLAAIDDQASPGEIASRIAESACRLRKQDYAAVVIAEEVAGRVDLGVFGAGRRAVRQVDVSHHTQFDGASADQPPHWRSIPRTLRQLADAVESNVNARFDEFLPIIHGRRLVGLVIAARQSRAGLSSTGWSVFARACGAALAAAIDRRRTAAQTEVIASLRRRVQHLESSQAAIGASSHLARMAAGAAHELNNPLAVISARAQMLLDAKADDRPAASLKAIRVQASRASDIVTDLLRLSRPRAAVGQPLLIVDWAERLRQHWHSRFNLDPSAVTVRVVDADVQLFADAEQLTEAATEIAANSLASAGSENLRLLINSESRATDETVVVSIGDNGAGMSPEVLRHALDPFYSERPAGRGRGLGLCKAAALIEANGGRIWIESAEGRGATVYLALPARVTG